MSDLKASDKKDLYKTYLTIKDDNIDDPSFYFDVASYLFQKKQKSEALRVLSNLVELDLENVEVMRTLGRKLYELQFYPEALAIFSELETIRSFEPHTYIDLGLTYIAMGKPQKGIETLYTVIERTWDRDIISRFSGIELIVLHEINSVIARNKTELNTAFMEKELIKNMPVDMRIVIDWDANDTDVDLHVTDPRREHCSYSNKETAIGGKISNDITRGYGPEEFRLKDAIDGRYLIEAKFYSSRKQSLLKNVTLRATVYTDFGTKNEVKKVMTLQLEPSKEGVFLIGEIVFEH